MDYVTQPVGGTLSSPLVSTPLGEVVYSGVMGQSVVGVIRRDLSSAPYGLLWGSPSCGDSYCT